MARKTKGRLYRVGKSLNYFAEYRVEGKRFRQLLRDKDGNPVSDRQEAERLLADILNPLNLHDQAKRARQLVEAVASIEEKVEKAEDIANPPLSIAVVWDAYAANPDRPDSGEKTLENYHRQWRQFKNWLVGNSPQARYLRDVSSDVAKRYAASMIAAKASPGTYNKHVGFLELLFRILGKEARVEANPFTSITRKKLKPNSRRALTIEELFRIVDAATGDFQLFLELGIYTGLRMGDCATLEWSNIDLERRLILRIPNKTASRKSVPVKIGIPSILHAKLVATPHQARKGYLLPELAKAYLSHTSRIMIVRRVMAHFTTCGIETHKAGTGEGTGKRAVVEVGFHSLRYSYIQLQSEIGTAQLIVQRQAGHSSPQMTVAYSDVSETAAHNAADGMARLLGHGGDDDEGTDGIRCRVQALAASASREILEKCLRIMES